MPADEKPSEASYSQYSLQRSAASRQFAGMPPINPRDRERLAPGGWRGLAGLAADVDYYARRFWHAALASLGGEAVDASSDASTIERERAVLTKLAELIGQARPDVVHDQIDHYSTGSSSAYATVERDVDAYADAVVGYLVLLVDAWSREPGTAAVQGEREPWESRLGHITRAIRAQAT